MGWGSSTRRVVAEKFMLSLESLSSLGFEERNLGCPGNFAGMSRTLGGVQKFVQTKFVRIFRSLITFSLPQIRRYFSAEISLLYITLS